MSTVIWSPSWIAAIGPPWPPRGDVADHQAAGGAGEAAVGDHRHRLAEALADDRRGDLEHLAHAGPPTGPSLRITTMSPGLIC